MFVAKPALVDERCERGETGRKRRLSLEDEYWLLLAAGVGTKEACRRVGTAVKPGIGGGPNAADPANDGG